MAINISNGAVLWSYQSGGDIHSTPAVSNNIVYFGSYDNSVYAIDASSGSLVWRVQTSDHIQSSPAVTNGVVYVGSYDHFATTDTGVNNGLLYALDASTGKMLWSYPVGTEVLDSPIVADAVVYAGGYNTDFYALNASTGAKLWSYQIEFPSTYSWSSAAVARGVLYVDFEGGPLFAFGSSNSTPTPTPTPGAQTDTTVTAAIDNGKTVNLTLCGNITSSQMSNVTIAVSNATTTGLFFTLDGLPAQLLPE